MIELLGTLSTWIDWIIVLVFALVCAAATFSAGSARAVAISIAAPLTVMMVPLLEGTAFVGGIYSALDTAWTSALVWLGISVSLVILAHRMIDAYDDSHRRLVRSITIGVATAVVAVVCWLHVPALHTVWNFGPALTSLFSSSYAILWILGAYIAIGFARR